MLWIYSRHLQLRGEHCVRTADIIVNYNKVSVPVFLLMPMPKGKSFPVVRGKSNHKNNCNKISVFPLPTLGSALNLARVHLVRNITKTMLRFLLSWTCTPHVFDHFRGIPKSKNKLENIDERKRETSLAIELVMSHIIKSRLMNSLRISYAFMWVGKNIAETFWRLSEGPA